MIYQMNTIYIRLLLTTSVWHNYGIRTLSSPSPLIYSVVRVIFFCRALTSCKIDKVKKKKYGPTDNFCDAFQRLRQHPWTARVDHPLRMTKYTPAQLLLEFIGFRTVYFLAHITVKSDALGSWSFATDGRTILSYSVLAAHFPTTS